MENWNCVFIGSYYLHIIHFMASGFRLVLMILWAVIIKVAKHRHGDKNKMTTLKQNYCVVWSNIKFYTAFLKIMFLAFVLYKICVVFCHTFVYLYKRITVKKKIKNKLVFTFEKLQNFLFWTHQYVSMYDPYILGLGNEKLRYIVMQDMICAHTYSTSGVGIKKE